VATRYASVLVDMAEAVKAIDKVEKDMQELEKMIVSSEDLRTMIANPLVNRQQQEKVCAAIAKKASFQKLTGNFLSVLAKNRRLPSILSITRSFAHELASRRGEVEATVRTAYALGAEQTKNLQKELGKAMGSNVTLNVEIDKDLLGGMTVTVGSLMIDDSVRSKLERLQRAMNQNVNENVETERAAAS
jgi:F-type H+-transporting ATPase subunit delta